MQTMSSDRTDERFDALDAKVDVLGQRVDALDEKVGLLDQKVGQLDQRMGRLEGRVDDLNREMHAEFRAVRGEVKTLMMVTIGGFVSLFAAMLGVMATVLTQL
jgi:predicted  nucleic acid-binding Zn-ribbon protein